MASCQKVPKFDLQSTFSMSQFIQIFLNFFSLMNTNFGLHFLLSTFFDGINFKIILLLNWCHIFDSSPLIQSSKFKNFLLVCWFFCKIIFYFVPHSPLETPQPVLPHCNPPCSIISSCSIINFQKNFHPARLLQPPRLFHPTLLFNTWE